jgi:hypothetical protein
VLESPAHTQSAEAGTSRSGSDELGISETVLAAVARRLEEFHERKTVDSEIAAQVRNVLQHHRLPHATAARSWQSLLRRGVSVPLFSGCADEQAHPRWHGSVEV